MGETRGGPERCDACGGWRYGFERCQWCGALWRSDRMAIEEYDKSDDERDFDWNDAGDYDANDVTEG